MVARDPMTLDVARAIWRSRLFVKDPEASPIDFEADWKRTRKHYLRVAERMLVNLDSKGYALIVAPDRRRKIEAGTVVSGSPDVAAMGEALEQDGSHLGVTEDSSPITEADLGGDDQAGGFEELAPHAEELCAERSTQTP